MTFTQKLTYDRATKNTFVFRADKGSAIETLYVRKDAFGGAQPMQNTQIEVEVKA